jgi:hypothetical protein
MLRRSSRAARQPTSTRIGAASSPTTTRRRLRFDAAPLTRGEITAYMG